MGRRPSPRKLPKLKLNDLLHRDPKDRQQTRFFDEVMGASDRAAVIALVARLDTFLIALIQDSFNATLTKSEMTDIFGASGVLSPTAAKVRLCRALGHYGRITKDDLLEIVRIRNVFAHSALPVTFRTPQISRACKRNLKALKAYVEAGLMQPDRFDLDESDAKSMFFFSVLGIQMLIMRRWHEHSKEAEPEMRALLTEIRNRAKKGQDISVFKANIKIP